MGQFGPKFQVEWVVPTNHSSSQKTRMNDLSYGIKIWAPHKFLSFCHNSSVWQTDRQTDRQTELLQQSRALDYTQSHGKNSWSEVEGCQHEPGMRT